MTHEKYTPNDYDDAFFAALDCPTPVTWAADIKGLFTNEDIKCMNRQGIDLADFNSVKANSRAIFARVKSHSMPPSDPWTPEMVNTFGCWRQQGCPE